MKEEMVIINNSFKDNMKKYRNFNFIQGILLIIIGICGLFFESKILLRLVVYILPLLLFSHVAKICMIAHSIRKTDFKNFCLMVIQAIILIISAVYIIINPFDTLQYLVMCLGALLIITSAIKIVYTKGSAYPIASVIFGILCLLVPSQLIDIFYTVVLVFVLTIGIFKLSAATFASKFI